MQTIVPSDMPVAKNPMGLSVRHLHETPHVMMSMLTLEPGESVAPHAAPVDVAFFVVEGSPVVQIEEESQRGRTRARPEQRRRYPGARPDHQDAQPARSKVTSRSAP